MPPLKGELGPAAGRLLAGQLRNAWPAFPQRRFTRGLDDALAPLELLARSDELADRLGTAMPERFSEAAAILYRALDSPRFTGWIVLPVTTFVARAGIDDPDRALPLLAALTPRWSSEFAIRPFIEQHPERTYQLLRGWTSHDDEHVRRLVSEGTRPRLPWASRVRALVADPSPNLPLLEALVADRSPYVRRSVANHVNDISKDHPEIALELAGRWLGRSEDADRVVRHALRSLVKRGDAHALGLLGASPDDDITVVELGADPERIAIGEAVTLTATIALRPGAPEAAEAIIDYRVHYRGPRGARAPKVFKLARRRVTAHEQVTVRRRVRFEHVSIRRIHRGRHRIDLQVNGRVLGSVDVDVVPGSAVDARAASGVR